jgi:hypothetical protein
VHAGARQAFGTGVDRGQGVLPPRLRARGVGGPTPEVDDEVALDPDGDGGTDLVVLCEVTLERGTYLLETGKARPLDVRVNGILLGSYLAVVW